MSERNTKQVIVMRRDLKMRRGKEIAQGAHAAMAWLTKRIPDFIDPMDSNYLSGAEQHWLDHSFRKITVKVDTLEDLLEVRDRALYEGVQVHVITDNGVTEFHGEPTITCLAVGPDWDNRVDKITGGLELY